LMCSRIQAQRRQNRALAYVPNSVAETVGPDWTSLSGHNCFWAMPYDRPMALIVGTVSTAGNRCDRGCATAGRSCFGRQSVFPVR